MSPGYPFNIRSIGHQRSRSQSLNVHNIFQLKAIDRVAGVSLHSIEDVTQCWSWILRSWGMGADLCNTTFRGRRTGILGMSYAKSVHFWVNYVR